MKQILRNITLASTIIVASASAMAADAPFTVTKVWTQKNIDATGNIIRSAAASKGNIYLIDKANTKLIQVNAEGVTTLDNTKISIGNGAITCDDAGNIIQTAKGFSGTDTFTNYRIFPADGSAAIDVTLPQIEEYKGRCDLIGRAMGDVLSKEGGVFFVAAYNSTKVATIYIAEGKAVEGYSCVSNLAFSNNPGSQTIANPRCSSMSEFLTTYEEGEPKSNNGTFYYKAQNNNRIEWLNDDNSAFMSYSTKANSNGLGWDVFEFDGVRYNATTGKDVAYAPDWFIAELDAWVIYHQEANDDFSTGNGYGGLLQVRPGEDAYTFYLYQAQITATTVDCGMWKIEFPNPDQTSVIDIDAENTNATPEYYNLQGVRVENPSNGLYIVKKGTKTYKQYVD